MRRIVFVDLDDTLFQTTRKNPAADQVAAVDREGKPLSFQCGRQALFLDWLARDAEVIAVTGRSVDAFRRVVLPLGAHAICSFGGVILGPDGQPNRAWHRRIAQAAATIAAPMDVLHAAVAAATAELGIDARHRVICDAGLPLYLSAKHNEGSSGEMDRLATAVAPSLPAGWTLHLNGGNMALLPPFLGKAGAVAFFLATLVGDGPILTVGVGDSLTDVGFMALCDYAIAPSRSQIFSVLSRRAALGAIAPEHAP
jgi:hypothetical protein